MKHCNALTLVSLFDYFLKHMVYTWTGSIIWSPIVYRRICHLSLVSAARWSFWSCCRMLAHQEAPVLPNPFRRLLLDYCEKSRGLCSLSHGNAVGVLVIAIALLNLNSRSSFEWSSATAMITALTTVDSPQPTLVSFTIIMVKVKKVFWTQVLKWLTGVLSAIRIHSIQSWFWLSMRSFVYHHKVCFATRRCY